MSVYVTTSKNAKAWKEYDRWCSIDFKTLPLEPSLRVPDVTLELNRVFDDIVELWLEIGKRLSGDRSATLAHTPSCAANLSDFGLVLAWSHLVNEWHGKRERILVICDDPWLLRHFKYSLGVPVIKMPGLTLATFRYSSRGYLARARAALRFSWAAIKFRKQRKAYPSSTEALLVYGHPDTEASGFDAYFGELMDINPDLCRVVHVDCDRGRSEQLADSVRTFTLHAWGGFFYAICILPFAKWRPSARQKTGKYKWLVRRAAVLDGSTGQAAAIKWQQFCQMRWLHAAKPKTVAWPWENHSWEREFVQMARARDLTTIGYQHTTIGKFEINYLYQSNADGLDSIPTHILTSGKVSRDWLVKSGFPSERIQIGGAWRNVAKQAPRYQRTAPVFVALPSDQEIARELIAALRPLGMTGGQFLVKDHPMSPFKFEGSEGIVRCETPYWAQRELSSVVYVGTTVGLEAVLDGIPTIEFVPANKLASQILPEGIHVPKSTAETLQDELESAKIPPKIDKADVFSAPDRDLWGSLFLHSGDFSPS